MAREEQEQTVQLTSLQQDNNSYLIGQFSKLAAVRDFVKLLLQHLRDNKSLDSVIKDIEIAIHTKGAEFIVDLAGRYTIAKKN